MKHKERTEKVAPPPVLPLSKQKMLTIRLTPEQVHTVGTALGLMPFNQVNTLINELQRQLNSTENIA